VHRFKMAPSFEPNSFGASLPPTEEENSFTFRNVGLISEHYTKDKSRNLLILSVNIRCVFIPDVMCHAVVKLRNHLYVLRLKKRKLLL
jgi:hypothetical protein